MDDLSLPSDLPIPAPRQIGTVWETVVPTKEQHIRPPPPGEVELVDIRESKHRVVDLVLPQSQPRYFWGGYDSSQRQLDSVGPLLRPLYQPRFNLSPSNEQQE